MIKQQDLEVWKTSLSKLRHWTPTTPLENYTSQSGAPESVQIFDVVKGIEKYICLNLNERDEIKSQN